MTHVVIIGGGFGGLSAAKALRKAPVRVTLVDRHNHHLFQPLLYQVATATLSPGDIASLSGGSCARPNTRDGSAMSRDRSRASRRITLEDEAVIGYDYLIVATGTSHTYFGHDEWAPYCPGLEDARRRARHPSPHPRCVRGAEREADPRRQQRLLTFVLVGGGPTGVELAGTLAEIARQTRAEFRNVDTQLDTHRARSRPGPRFCRRSHRRCATPRVARSRGCMSRFAKTRASPGWMRRGDARHERLDAGTVLWTAGVAASPITSTLGVPARPRRRVIVERDLSVPVIPKRS
jgi:NADH dehydrogenase